MALVGFAAYAVAGPAKDARIHATPFSVDPGLGGAFARCPAHRRAVGGGVIETGSRRAYVSASGPLDATDTAAIQPSSGVANTKDGDVAKQWYAGVSNASSRALDLKVLALCSKASDARIQAKGFWVAGRDTGVASAKCPAGKRAVGGGLVQAGWPDDRVLASGPLDASGAITSTKDGDKAKRWYAAVHNLPAHRVHFKVFALCSADSHARIQANRFSVKRGRTGDAVAKCHPGTRAVGGGIIQFSRPRYLRVRASGPLDATGTAKRTRDGDVAKGWYAAIQNRIENPNGGPRRFKVFAICEPV